ncbi:MAG: four helix bundle protein [Nitrospirota bacterium]
MRRAALSIPSNMAEGFNRFHNKEYQIFNIWSGKIETD